MSDRQYIEAVRVVLAFGFFVLQIFGPFPSHAYEPAAGENAATAPGLADKNGLAHFQLQPFNVPVIRDGRVARILTITVSVETRGDENKNKVMAQRYQLYDAFLRDIHGVAAFDRADGRHFDPVVLKTRLRAISDRILGVGIVEDILVMGVFDRHFF